MKTFELSLTKTEYLITTIEAETPEDAVRMCKEHHEPADVEIHAVTEIHPEPAPESITNCFQPLVDLTAKVTQKEKRYTMPTEIQRSCEKCQTPMFTDCTTTWCASCLESFKYDENVDIPVVTVVQELVDDCFELCMLCRSEMLTDGVSKWCSKCANLEPVA